MSKQSASQRASDVLFGLLYIGLIIALLLAAVLAYQKAFEESVRVEVNAGDIGSAMRPGSDVKVKGVLVGTVDTITPTGDGAVLGLELEPEMTDHIPADSVARLLPKTLFGERYVALIPHGTGTESISDGDVISIDDSVQAVELEQVFDQLLPVLQAVQPEKLAASLGELSEALHGQGDDLGDALVQWAAYMKQLNPKVPQLTEDLEALASVADTYNVAAPDLLTALDDFRTTSTTLVEQRAQLQTLFDTVTTASDATTGFVGANEETIIILSRDSRKALEAIGPYATQFPCLFSALRTFVPRMDEVLGEGSGKPGVHAELQVVPSKDKYGPGDGVRFQTNGKATCPYVPGGRTPRPAATGSSGVVERKAAVEAGLGTANSRGENQLIAELVAPTVGMKPEEFPAWGSLLVGPALRNATVTLR